MSLILIVSLVTPQAEVHCTCTCPMDTKLPRIELTWMKAQREKTGSKSVLVMSGMDGKEVRKMENRAEKKLRQSRSTNISESINDMYITLSDDDCLPDIPPDFSSLPSTSKSNDDTFECRLKSTFKTKEVSTQTLNDDFD